VFNSSADFSGFNQFNDRPDVIGTGSLHQDNSNPDAAFDKTYFSSIDCDSESRAPGHFGRNQYYGPGLQNWNFAVAKVFRWVRKESFALPSGLLQSVQSHEFRQSCFKPEQRELGKITATVGSAVATAVGTTAGVVGGGPRVIQGALRVEFLVPEKSHSLNRHKFLLAGSCLDFK